MEGLHQVTVAQFLDGPAHRHARGAVLFGQLGLGGEPLPGWVGPGGDPGSDVVGDEHVDQAAPAGIESRPAVTSSHETPQ